MNSSARPELYAPAAALRHGVFIACYAMILFLTTARADPRTSTNYTITTDTSDAGGKRATSANYTNEGSAGGIVGISTVAAPAETAKHGYMGQITEVSTLQIAATPTTVNETVTRQLSATALLDDLTSHAIPANSINWSVASGPLTSIDSNALATAATVYQNTAATAQGIYGGNIGTLNLTVVNTLPDNFGTYAGDGIGDDWQFQYFGLNNPNAAPAFDADFDGLKNLLEWACNLNPTLSSTLPTPVVRNGSNLEFSYTRSMSAVAAGAAFTVEWSDTLPGTSWSTAGVDQVEISNNGTLQQMKSTLPIGSNGRRFVRLSVSAPP
jgi:hypothetical protein